MVEILTSRAKPTAASQAANTRITMGIENVTMEWVLSEVIAVIINRDSIMPSKHRRVDIRWDRNIRVPVREKIKAKIILKTVVIMLVIMASIII